MNVSAVDKHCHGEPDRYHQWQGYGKGRNASLKESCGVACLPWFRRLRSKRLKMTSNVTGCLLRMALSHTFSTWSQLWRMKNSLARSVTTTGRWFWTGVTMPKKISCKILGYSCFHKCTLFWGEGIFLNYGDVIYCTNSPMKTVPECSMMTAVCMNFELHVWGSLRADKTPPHTSSVVWEGLFSCLYHGWAKWGWWLRKIFIHMIREWWFNMWSWVFLQ